MQKTQTKTDLVVRLIRYFFIVILLVFIAQTAEIQLNIALFLTAGLLGLYSSNRNLNGRLSGKQILKTHLIGLIAIKVILFLLRMLGPTLDLGPWFDLNPSIISGQVDILLLTYGLSYLENHFFWTKPVALNLELLLGGSLLILLLSGHRGYKIDMPNTISSLTWKLGILQSLKVDPEELLIGIAFSSVVIGFIYVFLSASRSIYGRKASKIAHGKAQRLISAVVMLLLITGFGLVSKAILKSYSAELSQATNGVGTSAGNSEGKSNLGFNKASTPSKQPAALLRLQNSYDENPWKPMMYLREGSLSEFNGREIVKASPKFDSDAPFVESSSPLLINPPPDAASRKEVVQAVYILSDKAIPFALDAPIQYQPIKNPNPKRFRNTYIAKSLAPVEPLAQILSNEVGEESWSLETWEHYLDAPGRGSEEELSKLGGEIPENIVISSSGEDLRYAGLVKKLIASIVPEEQIFQSRDPKDSISKSQIIQKIIMYLSKESIYVLEPKHTLPENGDPVAPYLFKQEKRGYCVHFAHAASYLLRLAGIPARIGTGYLVDLQYAKGGDILVQMGDRHAWPEVYIRGRGWVVVDVTPERAESDQVPIPDQNLLEELMNEIDPIEEIPGAPATPEVDDERLSPIEQFAKSRLAGMLDEIIICMFAMLVILKLWLRHAWRFPGNYETRLRRANLGVESLAIDLNMPRKYGETKVEYARRLKETYAFDFLTLSKARIKSIYGIDTQEISLKYFIKENFKYFRAPLRKIQFILSYLNPVSLIDFLQNVIKERSFLFLLIILSQIDVTLAESTADDPQISSLVDESASLEDVLIEATSLFKAGKGIDARAKLENILTRYPNDYRPFLLLGQYYLTEVGHFKLAYRYIAQAKILFEKKHDVSGNDYLDFGFQNQHALILYLLSEAQLSLDKYEDSLSTLDEYAKLYQGEWYAGQRAWILMKLKRINEAIKVAKDGVYEGADPKRTWNILGILFSISGERELSLQAFARAVEYEFRLSIQPQAATPINNAGEVYREIFKDDYAESAWKEALGFPDGCDHILPSVNLSILYTDQLRLYAAEKTLQDFEACYANRPEKKDTEHRTILALARGKINLLSGNPEEAERLLQISSDDQQWFGKIGTNENDIKFASWVSSAQLEQTKAEFLREKAEKRFYNSYLNLAKAKFSDLKSWWLTRKARIFTVTELDDFEDLYIRHTDTMIMYPTLGSLISTFDKTSAMQRLKRLTETDNREGAKRYYDLYKAEVEFASGNYSETEKMIEVILPLVPQYERLFKAEALGLQLKSKLNGAWFWNKGDVLTTNRNTIESLFELSPFQLRYQNIPLVATLETIGSNSQDLKNVANYLEARRFKFSKEKCRYKILLSSNASGDFTIQLYDTVKFGLLLSEKLIPENLNKEKEQSEKASKTEITSLEELVNQFQRRAFSYYSDGPAEKLPKIPFLKSTNSIG